MPGRNDGAKLVCRSRALKGRSRPREDVQTHFVSGRSLQGPFPEGFETIHFAMGCFWGAERLFWQMEGVHVTAAGYQGGFTPNPTYEEVCSEMTGHAESVMVVFDPARISLDTLLKTFWENHDPTQGMKQGNDIGTQYRSAIFVTSAAQLEAALASRQAFGRALAERGLGEITTQILKGQMFYLAEDHHQQYLAKNPDGYCSIRGTGVACPASAP